MILLVTDEDTDTCDRQQGSWVYSASQGDSGVKSLLPDLETHAFSMSLCDT